MLLEFFWIIATSLNFIFRNRCFFPTLHSYLYSFFLFLRLSSNYIRILFYLQVRLSGDFSRNICFRSLKSLLLDEIRLFLL